MDSLMADSLKSGADAANRPLFCFEGPTDLSEPILTKTIIAGHQLTLSGPSEKLDAAHWPVRGDLAHIRLAGRCFVPHYAVPMPHVVKAPGAALRSLGQAQADVLEELQAGDGFDVLDMSGGWCWGQVANDGFVGYIPHDLLALVTE
jgi:hypothetical protein